MFKNSIKFVKKIVFILLVVTIFTLTYNNSFVKASSNNVVKTTNVVKYNNHLLNQVQKNALQKYHHAKEQLNAADFEVAKTLFSAVGITNFDKFLSITTTIQKVPNGIKTTIKSEKIVIKPQGTYSGDMTGGGSSTSYEGKYTMAMSKAVNYYLSNQGNHNSAFINGAITNFAKAGIIDFNKLITTQSLTTNTYKYTLEEKTLTPMFPKLVQAQKGFKTLNHKTYYFDPRNHLMIKGFKTINHKTYYFDSKTGIQQKGFKTLNHKTYYFNRWGVQQKGLKKINGRFYYFNLRTGVQFKGHKILNHKRYNFR